MMHQAYISAMAWERGQGELSVCIPREMPDEQITMLETVDGVKMWYVCFCCNQEWSCPNPWRKLFYMLIKFYLAYIVGLYMPPVMAM